MEVNINYSLDFDRDVVYWNSYYKKNGCVEAPSLFAEFVGEKLVKGRKMLEHIKKYLHIAFIIFPVPLSHLIKHCNCAAYNYQALVSQRFT